VENVAQRLKQKSTRKKLVLVKEDLFHLLETECVYCCALGTCGGIETKGPPRTNIEED
jgi:hypothetical protein